jgi:hypothetical protein
MARFNRHVIRMTTGAVTKNLKERGFENAIKLFQLLNTGQDSDLQYL